MAQIRERLRKNGKKSFFVRIRMKRQPEVTASFDRLTDARLWASSTETAMREGRYIKTKEAQKHSLSDFRRQEVFLMDDCLPLPSYESGSG